MDRVEKNPHSYDSLIEVATLPEAVSRSLAAYRNKMTRYLFEISCLNGLEQYGAKHRLPFKFLKYFQKVMELYDDHLRFLLGHLRHHGHLVKCKPECAHCCYHMPTGISSTELIYLYQAMQQSGVFVRFFRRCLEAEEVWTQILRLRSDGPYHESCQGASIEEMLTCYHRLQRPCPFLHNDMCQIYPYRPFACRMHFSLSPPHWCHPAHFQNPHAVRFNLEIGDPVADALNLLDERLQLNLSDVMICGLLELTVNVMQFDEIHWVH